MIKCLDTNLETTSQKHFDVPPAQEGIDVEKIKREKRYSTVSVGNLLLLTVALGTSFFYVYNALVLKWVIIGNIGRLLDYTTVYLLVVYIACALSWISITKKVISCFFVMLLCCFLFNAGQITLDVFNIEYENWFILSVYYTEDVLYKSIIFQATCVSIFTASAVYTHMYYEKQNSIPDKISTSIFLKTNNKIDKYDSLFFASSLLFIIMQLMQIGSRANIGYSVYANETDIGSNILYAWSKYLFCVLFYFEFFRVRTKAWRFFLLVVDAIIILMLLLMGARFKILAFIFVPIMIFFEITKKHARIKWLQILLILLVCLFSFSFMKGLVVLRELSLSELSTHSFKDVYSEGIFSGLVDTTAEVGTSLRCLAESIDMLDRGDIGLNATISYALLLGFFPRFVINGLNIMPQITDLSKWITELNDSPNGWGFSLFAEAYVNLGGFGVFLFILFGFLFVCLFVIFFLP